MRGIQQTRRHTAILRGHLLAVFAATFAAACGNTSPPTTAATVTEAPAAAQDNEALNKAVGLSFLTDFFNPQDFDALPDIVAEDVIQHLQGLDDGRDAIETALRGWFPDHPEYHGDIKRAVVDGDLVMIHTHHTDHAKDRGNDFAAGSTANVFIFRIEDGLIAEFWEHEAPVQTETLNGNSAFDGGEFRPTSDTVEAENIKVIERYYEVINSGEFGNFAEVVAVDWIAHNPNEKNGLDNLVALFEGFVAAQPDMHARIVRIAAEGNLVFTQVQYTMDPADRGNDFAAGGGVDIFRIEDGLIREHWDVIQREIPPLSGSGRSVFSGGAKYSSE